MTASDRSHDSDRIDIRPDRISRNSLWIFLGLAGTASMYLVTIFFLTRYLGPEKFGLYSVALSLAGLFLPLADMGFDLHMTRTISANPQLLRQELSRTVSAKIIFSAGFWFLTILTAYLLGYSPALISYTVLIGFSLSVGSMAQAFIGAIRALQKMRYESTSLFAGKMVSMVGILLLIAMKANLTMILIAHIAGSITIFGCAVYFLKSQIGNVGFQFALTGFAARLKGALPFGLTAVFVAVYFKVDTVMLSKMVSTAEIGLYNGAYNIVLASMILSSPLVVALFPVLSSLYDADRDQANYIFREGLKYSILIGLPLGVGAALLAGPVVSLTYGARFAGSVQLLVIMSGTIPLLFATNMIGNSLGAVGRQTRVATVAGVNFVFNVTLNLILIPRIGARGAAIATLLTELMGLIQLVILSRGIYVFRLLPDLAKLFLSCAAALGGFILVRNMIGPWLAGLFFALIFAAGILFMRVVTLETIGGFMRSTGDRRFEEIL